MVSLRPEKNALSVQYIQLKIEICIFHLDELVSKNQASLVRVTKSFF